MAGIFEIRGKLPKARGDTSTVQVNGPGIEEGMLVTIVSGDFNSGLIVWVGTVKKKNKNGSWSVKIVALSKSTLRDHTDVRATVGTLRNPNDVQDTGEIRPLEPPPPPPPPPSPPT